MTTIEPAVTSAQPLAQTRAQALLRLQERHGLTRVVAEFLVGRGLVEESQQARFLEPRLSHLSPPEAMLDRGAAAKRIAQAVSAGATIVVFGDYDCDGITSAAIMTEALRACGARVIPHLANRFAGGYGVSRAAVERLLADKPTLLITCDCGSSDHESLRLVNEAGCEVVVIDHHLVPDEPLPAVAFLNPHRPECGFAYKGMASCGLALSVVAALRKELGIALDVRRWLDLVAIGTIADVAPLDGDNRSLVGAGLKVLATTERPGLKALLLALKFDGDKPLTGRDVAFRIAPQLNAPGRMGAPDLALNLLLESDADKAADLAQKLIDCSNERRTQQEEMVQAAVLEIESAGYQNEPAIVVGREGWNHGVVGIVAGRLAERYQRPVAVVGFAEGIGSGSLRGPSGVQLHTALSQLADCLERFGGHQAAAGITLKLSRLEEFRERFAAAIAGLPPLAGGADRGLELDCDAESPSRLVGDLARLEPCGEHNPRPILAFSGTVVHAREVRGGHLKLELALANGTHIGGFGINMGVLAATLSGPVRVLGDLRASTFPGALPYEMFLSAVEPG